jgi:Uma2 family endonuclease
MSRQEERFSGGVTERTQLTTKMLLTVEDMECTPKPEEGGGYELDEGELIYMSPNSMEQGEIIYRCYRLLKDFVEAHSLGLALADTWFEILPGVVRAPDVAFVPRAAWKAELDPKHALKVVPSLVIEVLGSSDPELSRKIALESSARPARTPRDPSRRLRQYLEAGVVQVWVLDPDEDEVDVYTAGSLRTLTAEDRLDTPAILPGLSVSVSRLFE